MDYKDIREKFVQLSGRYDLIKANKTDNGADFFLNAGQRLLDRMQATGKAKARYTVELAASTVVVSTTNLRAIKSVWLTNADGKLSLTPCTLEEIRDWYGNGLSDIDSGTPAYYAPAVLRPAPDTATAADLAGLYDIEDLILYNSSTDVGHWTYNGIVIAPPPATAYTLSIWGLFYSPTLSATLSGSTWTQTKSVWTELFPDTLLSAALYKLEAFYRNTEGAKDYDAMVSIDMRGLDHDAVEEEMVGDSQIGG